MEPRIIGLVAAMPEEFKPLLKISGKYKKEKIEGFDAYRFTYGKEKILLIKSGMGLKNAAAATITLIKSAEPCLIVNFGFCGGVTPGLEVGDIIVAQRILMNKETLFSPQSGIVEEQAKRITRALASTLGGKIFNVHGGTFITTAEIRSKADMARLVPSWAKNPVLDMETAAVARAAAKEGVPLISLRGVSDDAGEELGFSIGELTDGKMNMRIGKVIITVAKKPWIVPQLLRLAKNSREAGRNLALAMAALLEDEELLQMSCYDIKR